MNSYDDFMYEFFKIMNSNERFIHEIIYELTRTWNHIFIYMNSWVSPLISYRIHWTYEFIYEFAGTKVPDAKKGFKRNVPRARKGISWPWNFLPAGFFLRQAGPTQTSQSSDRSYVDKQHCCSKSHTPLGLTGMSNHFSRLQAARSCRGLQQSGRQNYSQGVLSQVERSNSRSLAVEGAMTSRTLEGSKHRWREGMTGPGEQ